MTLPELNFTNPPPRFARARYEKEQRGVINGKNNKPVELRVDNLLVGYSKRAECKGVAVSHSTRERHGYYVLDQTWRIHISDNGHGTVALEDLKLKIGKGKPKKVENKGIFRLKFTIFIDGIAGPSCYSEVMFDESCKDTCRPQIKDICPQVAAEGDRVWLQCSNEGAKNYKVMAQFFDTAKSYAKVECEVDGKVVKCSMPCLGDAPLEVDVRLQVHVAGVIDPIFSLNSVKLTYRCALSNVVQSGRQNEETNPRKRNAMGETKDSRPSKTFHTGPLWLYTDYTQSEDSIVDFSESASPKCQAPICYTSENEVKAFWESQRFSCTEEKARSASLERCSPPPEVTLPNWSNRVVEETIKLIYHYDDTSNEKRQRCSDELEVQASNFNEPCRRPNPCHPVVPLLANQTPSNTQPCDDTDDTPLPVMNSSGNLTSVAQPQHEVSLSEDVTLELTPPISTATHLTSGTQQRNHIASSFNTGSGTPSTLSGDSMANPYGDVYHQKDPPSQQLPDSNRSLSIKDPAGSIGDTCDDDLTESDRSILEAIGFFELEFSDLYAEDQMSETQPLELI